MNVAEAAHCIGCGRELGLEPLYEPGDLACPECRGPMQRFRGHPGRLHDCSTCGGQFVEHQLLRSFLERRQIIGEAVPRKARRREGPNPLSAPVKYRKCPVCSAVMNRKNFGGSSGVIAEVCSQHGLWFDVGELPLVLRFVEDGGLARERYRREEAARRREGSNRAARSAPVSQSYSVARTEATVTLLDAAIDGVVELCSWVID